MRYRVCKVANLKEKESYTFDLGTQEVGIVLHKGKVHAFQNICPHMGGPVCLGDVRGRVKVEYSQDWKIKREYQSEDELLITCPWHGYEFDVETGKHIAARHIRVKKYNAYIEDGDVVVEVDESGN